MKAGFTSLEDTSSIVACLEKRTGLDYSELAKDMGAFIKRID